MLYFSLAIVGKLVYLPTQILINQLDLVMKRFIAILLSLFLFSVASTYAQQLKFLGVPLCSDFSEFEKVLKEKRYTEKYCDERFCYYWEGGDFWKWNYCNVHLFNTHFEKDTHMLKRVTQVKLDLSFRYNREMSDEDYFKLVQELMNDLSEVYKTTPLVSEDKRYNVIIAKWTLTGGEVKLTIHIDYKLLELDYVSDYVLSIYKKRDTFTGHGKDDL